MSRDGGNIGAQAAGPGRVIWRDWLWLLMTVAGVLLLVSAALAA